MRFVDGLLIAALAGAWVLAFCLILKYDYGYEPNKLICITEILLSLCFAAYGIYRMIRSVEQKHGKSN